MTFSFSKVNFSLLEKKILLKKIDFFFHFRSYERSELLVHRFFNSVVNRAVYKKIFVYKLTQQTSNFYQDEKMKTCEISIVYLKKNY